MIVLIVKKSESKYIDMLFKGNSLEFICKIYLMLVVQSGDLYVVGFFWGVGGVYCYICIFDFVFFC